MNEYLTYLAIGVGVLFLALLVPGLKIIAEGIIKAIMAFFFELVKHKGIFWVWFVKSLIADHGLVFQHAVQEEDTLDPTQKLRRAAAGHEE